MVRRRLNVDRNGPGLQATRWTALTKMDTSSQVGEVKVEIKQEYIFMREPNEEDLCKAVTLLRAHLPHRSLEKLLIYLNDQVRKNKAAIKLEKEITLAPSEKERSEINVKTERVTNGKFDDKMEERREVAREYVRRGYGAWAGEQTSLGMQKTKWRSLLGGVLATAYRRLQLYMKQSGREIKILSREEMKAAASHLLFGRYDLYYVQEVTLVKFINMAFELEDIDMDELSAASLYDTLQTTAFPNKMPAHSQTSNEDEVKEEESVKPKDNADNGGGDGDGDGEPNKSQWSDLFFSQAGDEKWDWQNDADSLQNLQNLDEALQPFFFEDEDQ